jgi:hypothetical protein
MSLTVVTLSSPPSVWIRSVSLSASPPLTPVWAARPRTSARASVRPILTLSGPAVPSTTVSGARDPRGFRLC